MPCINVTLVRRLMLPSNPGSLHNHRSDAAPEIQQDGVRAFVPCFRGWAWMATSGAVTPEGAEGPMGGFSIRAGRPLVQSTRAEGRGLPPAQGQPPHRMSPRDSSDERDEDAQQRQVVTAGTAIPKIEPIRHRGSADARKTGW